MRLPFFPPVTYRGIAKHTVKILFLPNLIILVPYISYVEDVSFEWAHCNISSTESKVTNKLCRNYVTVMGYGISGKS